MKKLLWISAAWMAAACVANAQNLKSTPFPDGTGSIGLPAGWRLEGAFNGACQVNGPNGAALVLKFPWTVLSPDSSVASLPAAQQTVMAREGDMIGALRDILIKKIGGKLKSVRGQRTKDLSNGTPAYYLLYTYSQGGKDYTALGYFVPLVYPGNPSWQLYSSAAVAPSGQFAASLKTMLTIWKSWRPNGQPAKEGSSTQIFEKLMAEKRLSMDRIQKEFRENL